MASLLGKEISKYRITERIGHGGIAKDYLGIHTHLDCKVAVKVLHSHLLEGGDFVARFKRETKTVANLRTRRRKIKLSAYQSQVTDIFVNIAQD